MKSPLTRFGWVAVASTVLVVAGCGPSEGTGSDGSAQQEGDKTLKILYWQAPSTLNPYLSGGTKDIDAASLVLEPLAQYNERAEMLPLLAEEIPTLRNGGIAEDLRSITWKLKPGIEFSDGTPLTAEHVEFTGNYCLNPQMGCNSAASFEHVEGFEVGEDSLTITVKFSEPKGFPYGPFVGSTAPILNKYQFENCTGLRAQECSEQNFAPIGTGPFTVANFRAKDVITYRRNENFRHEGKPFFDRVIFKGGGEAASAARAVLETGEFDYAWNLQIEPEILAQMERAGKGRVRAGFGSQVERLIVNLTNDDPALKDERSLYKGGENAHPFLSDHSVRKALSIAIDRNVLVEAGYGLAGKPSCNLIPAPSYYASEANESCKVQQIDEANRILDEAGWLMGEDGVRVKNGVRLSILYQTSTNSVRQGTQALIKQMWQRIGVETELRNVDGAVFFGSDPASPDTFQKFFADIQMYTNNFVGTDPGAYVAGWTCKEIPGPDNQWVGTNDSRACDPEYDAKVPIMQQEANREERIRLAKELNDYVVQDYWEIPLIHRATTSAIANSVQGPTVNPWDAELWNIADWIRTE